MDTDITSSRHYNYWKWRICLSTMVCYLFYYSGRFNLGICASPIAKEFGFTNTQIGFLISAFILVYGTGQFINGNLGDRFGRILMPIGAVVSCLCNWAFSFAPVMTKGIAAALGVSYFSAVLFGTMTVVWGINGYFQSMGMAPGGRLISNWCLENERGRFMGFYAGASAMSNVTIFLFAAWLAGDMGWRWAFRIPPTLMAIVAIIFFFTTKDYPSQVGIELPAKKEKRTIKRGGHLRRYTTALKNRSFMLMCFSVGLHHVSRWGLLSFLPKFFVDTAGWDVKKAGYMATMLPLGMAAGAISGGQISDKVFRGRRTPIIFYSLLLCSICVVAIPYIVGGNAIHQPSPTVISEQQTVQPDLSPIHSEDSPMVLSPAKRMIIAVTLLVSGFFLYVCIGPYLALCPDLLGVENAGTGMGIWDAIAYGGAAVGTATVGILVDHYGYASAFWFMATCSILGAFMIKFVKETANVKDR